MKTLPFLLVSIVATASCSVPPTDARVGVNAPSENATQWDPVASYMGYHCGGLDCHGSTSRNFIVWSCYGLRIGIDAFAQPFCYPPTTTEEYNATYRSLVGLEPNVMSVVVAGAADGTADPDLLTFIRKARGEENHKGGTVAPQGSVGDICMTSWLLGTTNTTACQEALDGADGGFEP